MNQITISKDKSKLDIDFIYEYLTHSYWGKGRTRVQVIKSIENSICYGIYKAERQVGFARMISDEVVFTYLLDVFIDEAHQGNGYGKMLMAYIDSDPVLADVKLWYLRTKDAHGLYKHYNYHELEDPTKCMEKKTKLTG